MKKIALLSAVASLCLGVAQAAYHQAPPAFPYQDSKAIFVDFEDARYDMVFDVANKTVEVESVINFVNSGSGYPIFDLVDSPSEVILDGKVVSTATTQDPDKQTTLRVIQSKIKAGAHELRIKHTLNNGVTFRDEGVAAAFWFSDLNDRRYLEQYLPSNLEFDQYAMQISLKILDARPHVLKTNGKVSKVANNQFEVVYPEFYSASSLYFHVLPESLPFQTAQFYYPSIDGRLIPVDIYTIYNVAEWVTATKAIIKELEEDYGPLPHDQVIIYGNAPSGGMEYSGATATSMSALGHEIFHFYHARALMPANGNAGWMDEAIARWRDNKYPLRDRLTFESTRLAGHSQWSRMTDRMAYTEGSAFLSWIANRMNNKGLSFKMFLRDYFEKYKFTTVTTELFQKELSSAAGEDLTRDFQKYIYGNPVFIKPDTMKAVKAPHIHAEDPMHPTYTKEQLMKMTWPE